MMRVVSSGARNVPAAAGRSPFAGQIGQGEADEVRLEVVVEPWKLSGVPRPSSPSGEVAPFSPSRTR